MEVEKRSRMHPLRRHDFGCVVAMSAMRVTREMREPSSGDSVRRGIGHVAKSDVDWRLLQLEVEWTTYGSIEFVATSNRLDRFAMQPRGQQAVAVDEDSARRVHQAERMSAVAEFESELERIAEERARDRESRDSEASRQRSRRTREAQARRDGDGAAIQRAAEDASIFAEHRETFFGLTKADHSTLILNTARPPHLQRNRPKPLPLGNPYSIF